MTWQSGWTRSRVLFLSVSALLCLALMIWAHAVMLPFIMAGIVAYVLTPAVAALERRRVPSGTAVILVYFVLCSVVYMSITLTLPRLKEEAARLIADIPQITKQVSDEWGPTINERVGELEGLLKRNGGEAEVAPRPLFESVPTKEGGAGWELTQPLDLVQVSGNHWQVRPPGQPQQSLEWSELVRQGIAHSAEYAKRNVGELASLVKGVLAETSRAIFLFFMTMMCAAYLMITRDRLFGFFRDLCPVHAQPSFDRLLTRLDRGLSGVVRGQLLICLVNGVLTAIGFALLGLKYWPVLSVVAAVFSIIPIFGSILSTIPAVAVGLTQDIWLATWVLLWILGIHQVEANLLNPKIMGVSARLHPVLVVFSLVLGEHHFHLWGALLAVPTLSVCQNLFEHIRAEFVERPREPAELAPPAAADAGPTSPAA